jgi:hypothetical protein
LFILTQEVDNWIDEVVPPVGEILSRTHQVGQLTWGWIWPMLIVGILIGAQALGVKIDAYHMGNSFDPNIFPIKAINTLEKDMPKGDVFNDFMWGGYLLYRIWPQKRVFIDGQTDFYKSPLTREYNQVIEASPGWENILDKYQVQWIIIPPNLDVADWLDLSPDWKMYYSDKITAVWVRR